MANEHSLVTQKTFPVSMTVANATGIEKGSLLKLTDPNTVILHAAELDPIAGILYTEKIASDGNTKALVLTGPGDILKATASGSITVNDPVYAADAANTFINYLFSGKALSNIELSGSTRVGISLETATTGQTFKYVLNLHTSQGENV